MEPCIGDHHAMNRSPDQVSLRSTPFGFVAILCALLLSGVLLGLALLLPVTSASSAPAPAKPSEDLVDLDWGKMPLYFVPNLGRLDEAVVYHVQGADKTLYFTTEGVTFALTEPATEEMQVDRECWTVKLDYLGAGVIRPQGRDQTEAVVSYFQGPPVDWQTGIPTYSSICYPDLWEGIDLLYSGTADQLKQEFLVAPGADPEQVRLSYRGANVTIDPQGELEVSTPVGSFTDAAPVAYQEVDGQRISVSVEFVLQGSSGAGADEVTAYGFRLGAYNPALPLVIDPEILVYCGYVGGNSSDEARGIAVDASGNAYVTGQTYSRGTTFPVTAGSVDTSWNGGNYDAFVAKVNAAGTALLYCGYVGGNGWDAAYGIAVDASGSAYIAGSTASTGATFPVTAGCLDTSYNGGDGDAFVAKVNAAGTALLYCGYVGGNGGDCAYGIAVDSSGSAYIAGSTYSTGATLPVTAGSLDTSYNGGDGDAFVAKVNAAGTALLYCGYVGGNGGDCAYGIAVDSSGSAYIAGHTYSLEATFPVMFGSVDTSQNGDGDAFVAKVNQAGTALLYCGYVGGNGWDQAFGIAVDSSGSAYVAGRTTSAEATFPVTAGSLDTSYNGGYDAFVAKVNPAGTGLLYCSYIGGNGWDQAFGIAVDASGSAWVTGKTTSSEATFPVTAGALDASYNGDYDAFVARVDPAGTALSCCGYIGGNREDDARGIAVGSSGGAYVAGRTTSAEATFPVTAGSLDTSYNGSYDAFVARVLQPPTLAITNPSGGGTYAAGRTIGVNWTSTPATSAGSEYALWARSATNVYYLGQLVPGNWSGVYLKLDVPVGSGYQLVLGYRPVAGSGNCISFATSAAFSTH